MSDGRPTPGGMPGRRPGANLGPKPGGMPSPVPSPAAMPGAKTVDPEEVRAAVADVLSQPAPTPADRVAQFERAHEILDEALSSARRGGK
nr:hypothetical protein [Corynebacterium lactis]